MWHALETIPILYREPLVLFYRQHQSVEKVAVSLGLTEDTVKQRLSRGRKMLQDQVLSMVEGALTKTIPGKGFTLGVLAALPLMTVTASAATLGVAAAKGSTAAKAAAGMGLLGAILGPVIGIYCGWVGAKASLDNVRSPEERRMVLRNIKLILGLVLLLGGALSILIFAGHKFCEAHPLFVALYLISTILAYSITLTFIVVQQIRQFRRLQAQKALNPSEAAGCQCAIQPYEYRSSASFLGLPWIHIRTGNRSGEKIRPALGWIALGDIAVGILFSGGGVAVGGISIGGISIGLLTVGGMSAGAVALGGMAIGIGALGGLALGYLASGGLAIGWLGAVGGLSIAHEFAVGGKAIASQANTDLARAFIQNNAFLNWSTETLKSGWFQSLILLPMLVSIWQIKHAARLRKKVSSSARWK